MKYNGYDKDQVVHKVLCWWSPHSHSWVPYTAEQLTITHRALDGLVKPLQKRVDMLEKILASTDEKITADCYDYAHTFFTEDKDA